MGDVWKPIKISKAHEEALFINFFKFKKIFRVVMRFHGLQLSAQNLLQVLLKLLILSVLFLVAMIDL